MMRPVRSREEYLALRNNDRHVCNVMAARAGDRSAKLRLLQMNYSCLPVVAGGEADGGESTAVTGCGALKGSTTASMSVGMDVDLHREDYATDDAYRLAMAAIPARVLAMKEELGLLMLERSASKGYHLVFGRRPELSQVENLRWASELLGVEYDSAAKDITRVFFATTGSAEDLLYLDDGLFEQRAASTDGEDGPRKQRGNGDGKADGGTDGEEGPRKQRGNGDGKADGGEAASAAGGAGDGANGGPGRRRREECYDSVPYEAIVTALEEQLGGVPAHGSRNQFIFAMACHLRYVCDNDAEWIAEVLPTYGEARDKWMGTIRSACHRSQNKLMPKLLLRALDMARLQHEAEAGDGAGALDNVPPPMPRRLPPLIKLLVSRTPAIYQAAVAHAVFPALAAHLWKTRFRYIDNVEHEATLMNVLMAGTGAGKNCIAAPIDCIMRDIRERDAVSLEKERHWKEEMQTKGANKDKRLRPEGIVVQEVDADMTNAAFVLRLSEAEEHFLYVRMNEIDQFDALKTSARSKSQFQIMCLAFDPGNSYGQTRVGAQSVSARVCIRFNWNASTTILKGQQYFRQVLTDGPISRINFCTIPEQPIGAEMPVYGSYDAEFASQLKPYIDQLNAARGLVVCPQAERLARRLMEENADFARLSQSRTYENLSYRANVIAFLKAMVLYVAHGERWEKSMEDFIRWSERYDLWCKMRFFGQAIDEASSEGEHRSRRGPRNLLDALPERFSTAEVVAVRRLNDLDSVGTSHMLSSWKSRGYIEEGPEPDLWLKTAKYLQRARG